MLSKIIINIIHPNNNLDRLLCIISIIWMMYNFNLSYITLSSYIASMTRRSSVQRLREIDKLGSVRIRIPLINFLTL